MARPTTLAGTKLLIQLGDGASPEVFAAPCALSTKSFNLEAASNDFNVPDCDDPDLPVWTERVVSALSAGVSGNGTLAMESFDEWRDWFLSGDPKNVRVKVDTTAGNNGGYFEMSAILSSLQIGGNQGELVTVEVQMDSNGEVAWVDAV